MVVQHFHQLFMSQINNHVTVYLAQFHEVDDEVAFSGHLRRCDNAVLTSFHHHDDGLISSFFISVFSSCFLFLIVKWA